MEGFRGTKGKWQWVPKKGNRLAILESESTGEVCNFGDDYDYYPTEGVEPSKYDALLISKAPEMLDFINRVSGEMLRNDFVLDEGWYKQAMELVKSATELREE